MATNSEPEPFINGSNSMQAQPAKTAKALQVPSDRIVSIEHPCIVKNVDKGVKSLGGEAQVKNVGGLTEQAFHRLPF